MANSNRNLLIGAGIAGIAALLLASKREDENKEGKEGDSANPRIGFSPALDPLSLLGPEDGAEIERLLLEKQPVDLAPWEDPDNIPDAGVLHQTRRGEMLCGKGQKSICYMALRRAAMRAAKDAGAEKPDLFAERIASNANKRVQYAYLVLSSFFNDTCYGTWGYGARCLPGPHGRAFVFRACHADNRARISEGEAPMRTIPLCKPDDKGTGVAAKQAEGKHREYLWLPMLNLEALWEHQTITTQGVKWPDGSSGIEPPPEVMRLMLKGLLS